MSHELTGHGRLICICGRVLASCRCPGPHVDKVSPNPCACPGDKVELRVDITKPPSFETAAEATATIFALMTGQKWDAVWLRRVEIIREELNELEMQATALKAQRDAANNRIKYLENLILSTAKLAGVAS